MPRIDEYGNKIYSQGEYEHHVMMGRDFSGFVEDIGYISSEVVVTPHPINKSRSQFVYDIDRFMFINDLANYNSYTEELATTNENSYPAQGEEGKFKNLLPFIDLSMQGANYVGLGATMYATEHYVARTASNAGYFRLASGKVLSNDLLLPLNTPKIKGGGLQAGRGVHVQGVHGYRIAQQNAIDKARLPNRIGFGLGILTTGYSVLQFARKPSIGGAIDIGAGVGSIYSWVFAISYIYGSALVDGGINEVHTVQDNIINNRPPNEGVYNPATGQYMVTGPGGYTW